ncbi:hypothetical protein Csac_2308 [Caldicellulosiruptor saccharolyticus DSM 8903]|uniref:Uncharacterized protein n=1 Tax=Caldicellulosiruptor saccharolyticus (strain ATCC 43494 / DSM 8903 / Tp8T 6331) TaxID=351627 RepID=A4XLV1_CALS8|nr:hypothetical protein [Caldicellulosiruptor saccharolyticus]ABP67886.1 hypothetical protein Csac_2308 [Caldicellulosiruptor saccharolyticus DSM 8903]
MVKKLKRFLIASLLVTFLISLVAPFSFAQDDDGVIDFYTVFSKDDVNKNRVGNSIYNWSIYMPQDAYINKDPKGSYFSMSSSSYKANISVEAILNKEGFSSLDEILLYGSDIINNYGSVSKIYSLKKGKDKNGQEYIEITSVYTDSFYVFVDEEESSGTFNFTRIYLSKNKKYNYIYRLTISMDLNFYTEHKNLLYKIADSFELQFDSKNPNIKDLADNVTSWRVHKNTSYGWQIDLPPYWKSTDIYNLEYNSSTQSFAPLYTDEEMGLNTQKQQDVVTTPPQGEQQEYDEYLSVSFVANSNVSFDKWVELEMKNVELYNKSLCKIISSKTLNINGAKAKLFELNIRKSLQKNFVEKRMYVDFNNNKYFVKLYVKEDKYNKDKQKYDRIINSFKPIPAKSKYLDSILWTGDLKPQSTSKTVKLSKAPFEMNISKDYKTNIPYYYYSYYTQVINATALPISQGISDVETITLYNTPYSTLTINGGINLDPAEKIIKNAMQAWVESNEYKSKTVDMSLQKYSTGELTIYKFTYVYNLSKLPNLAKGNPNRDFNFLSLQNRVIYMIKYKQYYYTIDLSVPVLYWNNITLDNFVKSINTIKIDKVNFSKLNMKFVNEDLEKFKKKNNE